MSNHRYAEVAEALKDREGVVVGDLQLDRLGPRLDHLSGSVDGLLWSRGRAIRQVTQKVWRFGGFEMAVDLRSHLRQQRHH